MPNLSDLGLNKVTVYATAARLRAQTIHDEARRILPRSERRNADAVLSAIGVIHEHAVRALMARGEREAFAHADAAHAHADAAQHRIRVIAGGCEGEWHAMKHAEHLDTFATEATKRANEARNVR